MSDQPQPPKNRNRNRNSGKGRNRNSGKGGNADSGKGGDAQFRPPAPGPKQKSNTDAGKGNGKGNKGGGRRNDAPQPKCARNDNSQGGGGAKASLPQFAAPQVINPNARTSSTTLSQMTESRFEQLPLHENTQRALAQVLGYQTMTKVQAMSIPVALGPADVMVKAKTGTGKTLAFLIPALEKLAVCAQRGPVGSISILVISPTRELASQIMEEGLQLTTFHPLALQVVYGGTNVKTDLNKLKKRCPDVLVATPGRLNDLLENHGLQIQLANLQNLIFDEADQLLEMGFRPAITQMLKMLPPKASRQTLLFSATMPGDITQMAEFAMRPGFELVDCVGKEENTHQHVPQAALVHPLETQMAELLLLVDEAMSEPDYKVLIFFVTARLTQFFAELLQHAGIQVLEIHSRKSQSHRNKMSEQFRNRSHVVMCTSDVSARGMDYPDVSRVIQVGMPSDKAQYVHRLGRTARAGKNGSGVLVLADFEQGFLRQLKDLPVTRRPATAPQMLQQAQARLQPAIRAIPEVTVGMAYQAWLGFYNGSLRALGWSQKDLVDHGNHWVTECAAQREPPALQAKTVGKMGLKGVPGLRIEGRNGVPVSERSQQGKGGGKGSGGKGR